MKRQNPKPEPKSETPEKPSIHKTHEEFIGDMARPSINKKEYEKQQQEKARKKEESRDSTHPGSPTSHPD